MEQRLFIRHMMKTLKSVVLENREFEYNMHNDPSTLSVLVAQLPILCKDDTNNLEFDMGFDIIRSNYKIYVLCGSAYQGKNAVMVKNLKTGELIGQIIDENREKGTYNTTIEICDEIIRRNKKDNKGSISEIKVNVKKYKTPYEKAVEKGFIGTEQDFINSARISPLAMNFMPLASIDCDTFEQICEHNLESESIPEPSLYSNMYQDIIDSIDSGTYTEKLSNLTDKGFTANMTKVLEPLMTVLEKSGIIESISNVDELANLVRAAFYEYKYNAEGVLNFNIDVGSIDSFLRGTPMLKLILGLEDRIEQLKESGNKFNVRSFRSTMHEILLRLKMSSYLIDRVGFELYITKERTVQLYDITTGHEKLILFSADVSGILEDEDYNIRPFIPITETSDKLADELAMFTLVMTQNQLFLSKLIEMSLTMGDFYDMDMIFNSSTQPEENVNGNDIKYMKHDDSIFNLTLLQDFQLNENEIRKRYNQIMNDDSEDDDNK